MHFSVSTRKPYNTGFAAEAAGVGTAAVASGDAVGGVSAELSAGSIGRSVNANEPNTIDVARDRNCRRESAFDLCSPPHGVPWFRIFSPDVAGRLPQPDAPAES
jgi:hypothetical protein